MGHHHHIVVAARRWARRVMAEARAFFSSPHGERTHGNNRDRGQTIVEEVGRLMSAMLRRARSRRCHSVNLIALPTRLSSTCVSRCSSLRPRQRVARIHCTQLSRLRQSDLQAPGLQAPHS
jgi:hypothetical protein